MVKEGAMVGEGAKVGGYEGEGGIAEKLGVWDLHNCISLFHCHEDTISKLKKYVLNAHYLFP
jgi:hypothetical protein